MGMIIEGSIITACRLHLQSFHPRKYTLKSVDTIHTFGRRNTIHPLFLFQLSAVGNGDSLPTHHSGMLHVHRLTALGSQILQRLENVHSLLHLSENDMVAVEPRARNRRDEELGPVRVGSAVGHRQQTGAVVLQVEVLIRETLSVDRLASHSVSHREVASLDVGQAHALPDT